MIANERIFNDTIIEDMRTGEKTRVLMTKHHITNAEVPSEMRTYVLVKKGDHHMISESCVDTPDYTHTIISYKQLTLGADVKIKGCCNDFSGVKGFGGMESIENYYIETIGKMKLFVIIPMRGLDTKTINEKLKATHRLFSKMYGREMNDVELLDQVNVVDPYDIDSNFNSETERSIYRLTRSIRLMSKATHIVDLSAGAYAPGCDAEINVARGYCLNVINGDRFANIVRKINENNVDINTVFGNKNKSGHNPYSENPIPFGNLEYSDSRFLTYDDFNKEPHIGLF